MGAPSAETHQLKPFQGPPASLFQAIRIHNLVVSQPSLETNFPGVVNRYGNGTPRAMRNVGRIAADPTVHAFEIRMRAKRRSAWKTVGIGTLIASQVIQREDYKLQGTDIDYWLRGGTHQDIHAATVETLLEKARETAGPNTTAFAAIPSDRYYSLSVGFTIAADNGHLSRIGEGPAPITAPNDDPFGITQSGKPVQLYVAQPSLP
ncbi:MAG TPA: hypothetical protein VMY99_03975 [Nevskiaceae bacterium]|nr:hypothetical protein [Nevskiaceae bacterium]